MRHVVEKYSQIAIKHAVFFEKSFHKRVDLITDPFNYWKLRKMPSVDYWPDETLEEILVNSYKKATELNILNLTIPADQPNFRGFLLGKQELEDVRYYLRCIQQLDYNGWV